MNRWANRRRRAAGTAAAPGFIAALAVLAPFLLVAFVARPGPAAAAAAVATTATTAAIAPQNTRPSWGVRHELDRTESLLRERLAALPAGSGVTILRETTRVSLRIPCAVLFVADSTSLKNLKQDTAAAVPLLAAAQVLRKHRRLTGQVTAFTDGIGGAAANQSLTDQRAQAVLAALTGEGIATTRLQASGGGQTAPLGANDTPEGRTANRRVEIVFSREKLSPS